MKTKRRKKITRLRRNAYTTARGLESGRDLDFATRMRIARTRGGSEERYASHTRTPAIGAEDPLDTYSPKHKPIYRERRRKGLQVFRDDENVLHPIRRSPGYDPSKAKHDRGYHPRKAARAPAPDPWIQEGRRKAERVRRNPETFRVGDHVHLGLAVKGGAGFGGIIREIHGNTVIIEEPGPGDKFGKRMWKGPISRLTRNPKRRARKKAPRARAPRASSAPVVRARPDDAAAAVSAAAVRYRMANMSQEQLVKLHNRLAKQRKKSFDQVAVMSAAKICAMAKGASITHG